MGEIQVSRSPVAKPDSEEVIVQAYAAYMQALVASGRAPVNLTGAEQERLLTQAQSQLVGMTGFEPAAATSRTSQQHL